MDALAASLPSGSSDLRPTKRLRLSRAVDIGFMQLLRDPKFTDVKVLVGFNEREYNLHRNIISVGSNFFEATCREGNGFTESAEKLIKLPDIEPEEFDVIIKWIYRGGYTLPEYIESDDFCAVLQAADFLGVKDLKLEMQGQLVDRLPREFLREDQITIDDPVKLYKGIAQNSSISDWLKLRKLADQVFPFWYNGDLSLFEMGQEDLGNAVRIDLYQEIFNNNFCGICYTDLLKNTEKQCRICLSDLENATCRQEDGVPMGDTPCGRQLALLQTSEAFGS
ncbi:hypothetical protein TWF225_005474 [Orbilia oligospora]|nr:hypothetical protein TWF225_005474 [Orbilia oligospora]KAF3259896.1 hypothetical protein TWF128_003886 [Orbilia oligospora]KAF3270796.1 hypothetical protein TWF217_007071 [Orbilia oligospora]KAF3292281.1 hypothetical protein TWF132_005671 [Orbilia oligospora]